MANFSGPAIASSAPSSGGGGDTTTTMLPFGPRGDLYLVATFSSAQVSETALESPTEGDFWFDSANAELLIYYNNAWVGLST